VSPGDYVIADASSVVFIPQADVARVVEAAELIVQRESLMAQALRDGKRASEVMGANYEHMLKTASAKATAVRRSPRRRRK